MLKSLLNLLGVHVDDASKISHPDLHFRSGIPVWVVALLMILLAGLSVWLYRRTAEYVPPVKKYFMAALRILFLCLIALVLLRPVFSCIIEGSVRRSFLVLTDTTSSMGIKDPRSDAADIKRAAMAQDLIDPAKGLDQELTPPDAAKVGGMSRMDVLKAMANNKRLDLFGRIGKDFDLKLYSFPEATEADKQALALASTQPTTAPAAVAANSAATANKLNSANSVTADAAKQWVDGLTGWSPETAIGTAVRNTIGYTRGQPLAGILLITDGGNNSGSDPLMAARLAKQENVPVYTYGVGISSPKDVIVSAMFSPEVVFAKDEVPITVRVRAQNLKGQSGQLVVTLDGEQMGAVVVNFDQEEQVVPMKFTPTKKGEFDLVASIVPRADEAETRNNSKTNRVKVVDDKIKVLMIEQYPRWEFKYLQEQMLRDRRVDLKCVLLEGDPGISRTENSPYLPEFPKTKQDLNDKYDVIIFGDVDPKALTAEQIKNINEFVSIAGGGFIMIAGRSNAPAKYVGTPIENLLPIVLDPSRPILPSAVKDADVADKPIRMELTPQGLRNGMLRLSDKEQENIDKWRTLPPIFWDYRVARAKPAAEVLLVDPDPAKGSRFGKMPVVAIQQYGLGQVLFVGTDNTWRWRRNQGDQFYITLWGQMIQRTAMPHLLGSKRTQIKKDKDEYVTGERVTIYARLYGATYEPVADPVVKGYYAADSGSAASREVSLRPVPEQPGMYKGEFVAPTPGHYKFYVDKPGDPAVKEAFTVSEPTVEFGDTAMNEPLLKEISLTSGGQFFREETLNQLPDVLKQKTEKIGWQTEVELWSTKLYFLLLLAVVTAEWILRKTAQLK